MKAAIKHFREWLLHTIRYFMLNEWAFSTVLIVSHRRPVLNATRPGDRRKSAWVRIARGRRRSRRTRAIRSKSWAKRWAKRAARRSATQCWSGHDRLARLYRSFNGTEAVADWQRSGAVENPPPESQALAGNINEPQRANNKWGRDNDYRCCDRDHLALGSPLRDERDLRQPVSKARFIGPDCRIFHGREAMPRPARADRGCTGGTSGEVFVLRAFDLREQRIHSPRATQIAPQR
ncbi:MAG: hypothetical protein JNM23_02865 [Bradyrhizobiaceae bacterium]|nr:hypothetical protein [Bradyrhizobiaceae bacterium]